MAKQEPEVKTLQEKDAERAENVITDAQKREWRKAIKQEIEDIELNIKYYSYQLQLMDVMARWEEVQNKLNPNAPKDDAVQKEDVQEV